MISIKNVSKYYDQLVLDNINLELKPNNIYILKGISGSGKSTLLNLISGFDRMYEGSIKINNKELKNMNKKELEEYQHLIGYMLQDSLLYQRLTIKDNLLLINDNIMKILKLAKVFNIIKLLDKYPSELSGGERQRVALIRTLLIEHGIIILDEATANLDLNNSLNFVNYLKEIDIKNKIIIIATHKDIYDNIGNIFLNISYGKLNIQGKYNKESNLKILEYKQNKKITRNALKTSHKQSKFTYLFMGIMFLLSFISLAISLNFKKEYIEYREESTSFNVIDVLNDKVDSLSKITDYIYENYVYETDNYKVVSLFKINETNIEDYIYAGVFPSNNKEVLINNVYLNNYYDNDVNKALNNTITINDKEYLITGIVNSKYNTNYNNCYYVGLSDSNIVFMLYDELKEFGSIMDTSSKMVVLNNDYVIDAYTTDLIPDSIKETSTIYLNYRYEVSSVARSIKSITQVLFIIIIVMAFLTLLFVGNELTLELYYRKKELGFLQIFHFSKDDISWFITLEYIKSFLLTLVISFIIYLLIAIYMYIVYEFNLFINVLYLLFILIIFILYLYILINIPLNKYLKKDIVSLIR